jgi:hypothetical protein
LPITLLLPMFGNSYKCFIEGFLLLLPQGLMPKPCYAAFHPTLKKGGLSRWGM